MSDCSPISNYGHYFPLNLKDTVPNATLLLNLKKVPGSACWLYGICAVLMHEEARKAGHDPLMANNPTYMNWVNQRDTSDIQFPTNIEGMLLFLKKNSDLSIIVHLYGLYEGEVWPVLLNLGAQFGDPQVPKKIVGLLLLDLKPPAGQKLSYASLFGTATSHAVGIKSLDGYFAKSYQGSRSKYYKFACYR